MPAGLMMRVTAAVTVATLSPISPSIAFVPQPTAPWLKARLSPTQSFSYSSNGRPYSRVGALNMVAQPPVKPQKVCFLCGSDIALERTREMVVGDLKGAKSREFSPTCLIYGAKNC